MPYEAADHASHAVIETPRSFWTAPRPDEGRPDKGPFLARWPSRQAMQHARDRIRQLTARSRLLLDVEHIVQDLNRFLRGWVGYFRYGNSARMFDKIRTYAVPRLALFVIKRHKQRRPTAGRSWCTCHRTRSV